MVGLLLDLGVLGKCYLTTGGISLHTQVLPFGLWAPAESYVEKETSTSRPYQNRYIYNLLCNTCRLQLLSLYSRTQ